MKFKLRRREIILIAGFWIVGCGLLAVVLYLALFATKSPQSGGSAIAPQATFTLTHTQLTAKSMYPATEPKLSTWAEDAQLYTVAATWERTQLEQVGQPTAWTYRYYSPGQKRLFFITVDPYGQTTGISHGERVYTPPQPIPDGDWAIDSAGAVNVWLNYGGAAMLAGMPGIQVIAQLKVDAPEEPLTWTVAGFDPVSNHYHTVFVDANSGEVIRIVSSLDQM